VTTIAVRVKSGASRPRVGGRYEGPYGPAVVVAVNAPAVEGRANAAVLDALAHALGLRRSALTLHRGTTSRNKVVAVSDAPADLTERVRQLCDPPT
jgi:uncharacterized protein YggU (UPF0235/DUF167 family)